MRALHTGLIPAFLAALLLAGCATPPSSGSTESSGTTAGSAGSASPAGAPSNDGGTTGADGAGAATGNGSATGTGSVGKDPPASSGGTAGEGASVPVGDGAQTPDERRAATDRRLDDSLGSFDERIRKEQQAVANERDSRAGGNGSADTNASGDNAAVAQAGGRPGDLRSDRGTQQQPGGQASGDGSDGPARSSANTGGSGKSAVERADGSDDDIVARRLRAAAEQETDPELKERLWKEYDEYKKSVRGG